MPTEANTLLKVIGGGRTAIGTFSPHLTMLLAYGYGKQMEWRFYFKYYYWHKRTISNTVRYKLMASIKLYPNFLLAEILKKSPHDGGSPSYFYFEVTSIEIKV